MRGYNGVLHPSLGVRGVFRPAFVRPKVVIIPNKHNYYAKNPYIFALAKRAKCHIPNTLPIISLFRQYQNSLRFC